GQQCLLVLVSGPCEQAPLVSGLDERSDGCGRLRLPRHDLTEYCARRDLEELVLNLRILDLAVDDVEHGRDDVLRGERRSAAEQVLRDAKSGECIFGYLDRSGGLQQVAQHYRVD